MKVSTTEQQETVLNLIEVRRLAAIEMGKFGVAVLEGATEEGVLRS